MPDIKKITGMSDDAVKSKTGKDWAGWFAVLDKAGAKKMAHRDIAELLSDEKAIELSCDYCGKAYEVDPGQLRALLDTA